LPKDSKNARFEQFLNKELNKEKENPEKISPKLKGNPLISELYQLPSSIKYANYNENHDVIDQTHWLSGLAEVDRNDPRNRPKVKPVQNEKELAEEQFIEKVGLSKK
jgi:hypothetical protein